MSLRKSVCGRSGAGLKVEEQVGKSNAGVNSQAARHVDDLQARLHKRMEQLGREAQITALTPIALGGLVVVPIGRLAKVGGQTPIESLETMDNQAAGARSRLIVMQVECQLGSELIDREHEKLRYDVESRNPRTGKLRFMEVKGRLSIHGDQERNPLLAQ